jgi:hypothetical protein
MTKKPTIETRVALRIAAVNLEPEVISQRLGLKPSKARRRGDPNIGRNNRAYSDFSSGLWLLESSLDVEPLEKKLETLISRIQPKQAEIRALGNEGLEVEIIIGVFGDDRNAMFYLSSKVVRDLGEIGINLAFDVYA